jgi:hypothetical protein
MCQFEFCSIKPNYNFYTERVGIFCNKHKQIGMVNVKTYRKCSVDNCMTDISKLGERSCFGPNMCQVHKEEYMKKREEKFCLTEGEVVRRGKFTKCEIDGCAYRGDFNYILNFRNVKYCSLHKLKGMVPQPLPKKTLNALCLEPDCGEKIYILSDFQLRAFPQYPYCLKHRKFYYGFAQKIWRRENSVSCHNTVEDDGYGSPYEEPKWCDSDNVW